MVRIWILLSALLVGAGWGLSALHQLNRTGYVVVFALAGLAGIYWRLNHKLPVRENARRAGRKFRRRFLRPAPLLFLALALMSFAAGLLYIPFNEDSSAYRIPRVFHWLAQEQWHWIRTGDLRMNIAGCGFEWLSAPLILFTRTDRWLFLINAVSYLMLPGLIFSVFTRLGVRSRVSWWWMWLLPSGWCFAMQAASVVNDSFAAIYALAAVDFALRARQSKRLTDLWLSMLAAALLTGVKQTDVPLALLWLMAAWPSLWLLKARPVATAAVAVLGLLVSVVPVAVFNFKYCATWMPIPPDLANLKMKSPFWGIIGNAFCLPAQNLVPPFFPWAESWNAMMDRFVQTPFGKHFASFEHFGVLTQNVHGVNEFNAGIGLWICALLFVSVVCARRYQRSMPAGRAAKPDRYLRLFRLMPWALLLLFMAKVGSSVNARHLSPYYLFFFPSLLAGRGHEILAGRRWWQRFGLAVMLLTAVLLVMARHRPLFPARTMLGWLQEKYPDSKLVSRALFSYTQHSLVVEPRRELFKKDIPADEQIIGYAAAENGWSELGLWLPFGHRRVERVLPADTPERLSFLGICYVVVDGRHLNLTNETISQWLNRYDGDLVNQTVFQATPTTPLVYTYLVRLRPHPPETSGDASSVGGKMTQNPKL